MAALRRLVTPAQKAEWDQAIAARTLRLAKEAGLMDGRPVYLYMDIRNEAGTGGILKELWRRKIPAALPRVEGRQIRFYLAGSPQDLAPGAMGILEPAAGCPPAESRESLVLTPGVAFDRSLLRLGYGGGYYDRFFQEEPAHPRWGLAYEFQVIDALIPDPWDCRVDRIITEEGAYDASGNWTEGKGSFPYPWDHGNGR